MTEASHPVALFTGQRADLPFEEVRRLAAGRGCDGVEVAPAGEPSKWVTLQALRVLDRWDSQG